MLYGEISDFHRVKYGVKYVCFLFCCIYTNIYLITINVIFFFSFSPQLYLCFTTVSSSAWYVILLNCDSHIYYGQPGKNAGACGLEGEGGEGGGGGYL